MTIAFPSLGVQCIKKKEIEEALMLRQEIRVDPFQSESLTLHANSQQAENECDCGNPIPPPSLFPLPVPRTEGGREARTTKLSITYHVAHLAADITQFKPKWTQFYEKWWFRYFSRLAAGFSHKDNPQSLDLNCVRLCFQVFLEGNEKGAFTFALKPVVSDPIYDKSEWFSFNPMKSVLMMRKLNRGKDGIIDMPHDRIQRVCRRWKGYAALLR